MPSIWILRSVTVYQLMGSYVLILAYRATRYNWTFGLKDLSSDSIILALCLFCASRGSLAHCFYSNCDLKLFSSAVSEYLIDGFLQVVTAPAKCQSAYGLVKLHWKVMVHMGHAYLTKKQIPHSFWFYAITHAARLMNSGHLASPFLLVHGVGQDKRT
jgi:hypothetical protein